LIVIKKIFIFIILFICSFTVVSQSKLEIEVSIGYSNPLLESRGGVLTLAPSKDVVFINDERWIVSDYMGARDGYTVQAFVKYNVLKEGYLKALFNLGYNALVGVEDGPEDTYGVRIQIFLILGWELK
jgi:hypothetical protein